MALFVYPRTSAFGLNLKPAEGSELEFYESGTTTPKTVYSDPDMTIAHTQPVPAVANGIFPAIYLSGTYKVVLRDPDAGTELTDDEQIARAGAVQIKGDFDSTNNSSNYPASGSLGDMYRVTATFTLAAASGGHQVVDGDFIMANKNGATAIDADWDIIRGTLPNRAVEVLTVGATTNTDCSKATVFTVALDQNSTLNNPTNKLAGYTYTWIITQDSTGDRTLAFGTDFVFEGRNKIKPEASSVTIIKGTCVSSTVVRCKILRDLAVKFESDNLLIGATLTNTTITVTADRLSFLTDSGDFVIKNNISETFDITTDLMSGTTEKASHDYQLWFGINPATGSITRMMVPDLTGTADGNTANKLIDSGADFVTDKVSVGDIVYNLDDLTQGPVTSIDDLNTLGFATDLFPDGNENYRIRLLSPTGLGDYKSRIGKAYNDASSNLTDHRKNGRARITESFWHTVNGYGSSSTTIQKFTTEVIASDNVVVTVENSATLGFTITANMDCTVNIGYAAHYNTPQWLGISKNSTQLTTSISGITTADIIGIGYVPASNVSGTVSREFVVKKGDVLRTHGSSSPDGSTPALGHVSVLATEII